MNPLFPIAVIALVQVGPSQPPGEIVGQISAELVSIKGLSIGSTKSQVISALGKSAKSRRGYDSEMGMGHWQEMYFPGLVVEVTKPDPDQATTVWKEPRVWRMVIKGKSWRTKCGLRVGQTREQALAVLGQPASEDPKGAATVLHYFPKVFDGFLWVEIQNGLITEIGVSEDWT